MTDENNLVYLNEEATRANKGPIFALMKLLAVRKNNGKNDIALAAGLPDHNVPETVKTELTKAASYDQSPYLKYDLKSPYNEGQLHPEIAAFHKKQFGIEFTPDQVHIAAGSTPVLGAVAYVTQKEFKTARTDENNIPRIRRKQTQALMINPGYPLMTLPITRQNGVVNTTARLVSELDIDENGNPFQTDGRWKLDMDSFRKALEQGRMSPEQGGATMLYLNFPSNPTGYAPTEDEYQEIAKELADDLRLRREQNLPSLAILEDIAYATMMHGNRTYYTLNNAIEDLKSIDPPLYSNLDKSVIVAHSFSKAFAVAGQRVSYYASKNPQLLEAVYGQIIEVELTPSAGTLATMKGCLNAGEVDEQSMRKYGNRLRFFEDEYNKIIEQWMQPNNITESNVTNSFQERLKQNKPIPAKADAGFFSSTNGQYLLGAPISDEKLAELKQDIDQIQDPGLRQLLSNGIFKDNKVNNALDAALWLVVNANVVCIPMQAQKGKEDNIKLRFSVGQTSIETIQQAMDNIKTALDQNLPTNDVKALSHGRIAQNTANGRSL